MKQKVIEYLLQGQTISRGCSQKSQSSLCILCIFFLFLFVYLLSVFFLFNPGTFGTKEISSKQSILFAFISKKYWFSVLNSTTKNLSSVELQ